MNAAKGGAASTAGTVRGADVSVDGDVVTAWRLEHGHVTAIEPVPAAPPALWPGVTVAVCTYRRATSLLRLLRSLPPQTRRPAALYIIDASPDDEAEQALRGFRELSTCGGDVRYYRVRGRHKGLTRQRNFALDRVETDLVAFFDDDLILEAGCLEALETPHRRGAAACVGVAALLVNERSDPAPIWRVRRALGIIPDFAPGRYYPSGVSTSWSWIDPAAGVVAGDYLPGGATMWRTAMARAVRFNAAFYGYAQGEDLEFSLRAGRYGRLVINTAARARHLHAAEGRPETRERARMAVHNWRAIHHQAFPDRPFDKRLQFTYGFAVDTVLLLRLLAQPRSWRALADQLRGRAQAVGEIVRGETPRGEATRE